MASNPSGLGRVCDFTVGIAPVDTQTGAMTGKKISMENCGGVMFVLYKAAGAHPDDYVVALYEHTAYTGGTSTLLACITRYWQKKEATLDGDEAWVEVTQTAASANTADASSAEAQMIIVFDVRADQLSAGYTHVSMDYADTGSGGTQPGCILAVPYDLKIQRSPANLPSWLRPGTANA